jgi:hypothetical protein
MIFGLYYRDVLEEALIVIGAYYKSRPIVLNARSFFSNWRQQTRPHECLISKRHGLQYYLGSSHP